MRFDLETTASPEQVSRALTDFSERRLQTWSRTLDPETYELRDHGEHWALVRESSPRSPVWVVLRYDWTDPAVVRWTVEDSSYGGDGGGEVRISPRDGGGSRVHAEWVATHASGWQRPLVFLVNHGPMGPMVARMWTSALDRYAAPTGPDDEDRDLGADAVRCGREGLGGSEREGADRPPPRRLARQRWSLPELELGAAVTQG